MMNTAMMSGKYWKEILKPPFSGGPVVLLADGSFMVRTVKFDQLTVIDNCQIADSMVDKRAGVGEILTVRVENRGAFYARFDGENWFVLVRDKVGAP
jgi:hypothetical protein